MGLSIHFGAPSMALLVALTMSCSGAKAREGEAEAEAESESEAEAEAEGAGSCGDGVDNDGDGLVDLDDPGCSGAEDNDEQNGIAGACGEDIYHYDVVANVTVVGSLPTQVGEFSGTCGGLGPEMIYRLDVKEEGAYVFSTAGSGVLDTVLHVRTDCDDPDSEVGCNDQGEEPPAATLVVHLGPGEAFVFVDGWSGTASGSFVLSISHMLDENDACDEDATEESLMCAPWLLCRTDPDVSDGTHCLRPLCSDGSDDDDDGLSDFPYDPGCEDELDSSEEDSCPEDCPDCGDGADNDLDGLEDFPADPGCTAASDVSELAECIKGVLVAELAASPVSGDIPSTGSSFDTCGYNTEDIGEDIYAIAIPEALDLLTVHTVEGTADTVISVRTDCGVEASELACDDLTVSLTDVEPGTYFIFVDGDSSGSYTLEVRGTLVPGAGCSSSSSLFFCGVGYQCDSGSDTCEPTECNNESDDDADSLLDYPEDPGCSSVADNDEGDSCPGAGCPECADGTDNDTDGDIDWPEDASCNAASDDNEACSTFGSDTYGYTGCQEVPSTPPCPDLMGAGATEVSLSDDGITEVPIGFTFDFYGVSRTTARIASNGKLGFPGSSYFSNSCLPDTDEGLAIFVWWDDLDPSEGGGFVAYQTTGTTPNRTFEVQWVVQHFPSSTGTIDVRAVLHESGDVDVCYVDTTFETTADHGGSATTGIQGSVSGEYLQFSCNETVLTSGLTLRYLHP